MTYRRMIILLLTMAAFGALLVLTRYVTARPSTIEEPKRRWEYCWVMGSGVSGTGEYKAQVIFSSPPAERKDEIESSYGSMAVLNKLGGEGWELVAVIPNQSNPGYFLKRPRP